MFLWHDDTIMKTKWSLQDNAWAFRWGQQDPGRYRGGKGGDQYGEKRKLVILMWNIFQSWFQQRVIRWWHYSGEPGRGPAEQHRPGRGAQPGCGGHPQHKVVNESLYCTSLLFREFMWNLHYMWSLPLKIVAIIGLVYSKLGFPAALVRDLALWSDLESCLPTNSAPRHVKHVVFWNQTFPYNWPSTWTFK